MVDEHVGNGQHRGVGWVLGCRKLVQGIAMRKHTNSSYRDIPQSQ